MSREFRIEEYIKYCLLQYFEIYIVKSSLITKVVKLECPYEFQIEEYVKYCLLKYFEIHIMKSSLVTKVSKLECFMNFKLRNI